MLSLATTFRLLNELVFVLLGLLLVQVALSGKLFFDRRSAVWIAVGAFLVYWGLRALVRAGRYATRWQHRVRGGSLMLVGTLVLSIAWVPWGFVAPLLATAGIVLVVRGALSAVLVARTP